jgi:ubiquitin-hydrolase Zn-finger-containing protein
MRVESSGARPESMAIICKHLAAIRDVVPSAPGCEECLKLGDPWLHLRVCRTCGHVGCCNQSPNRHATKHFHATKHPIIEAYDPPEGWGWCYVDEVMFDLSGRPTPRLGPIPLECRREGKFHAARDNVHRCCNSCGFAGRFSLRQAGMNSFPEPDVRQTSSNRVASAYVIDKKVNQFWICTARYNFQDLTANNGENVPSFRPISADPRWPRPTMYAR